MKEKKTEALTKKQEDFCCLYLSLGSETEAARLSGHLLPTPRLAAEKLLKSPGVKKKIGELKRTKEKESLREKAVKGLLRLALSDPADALKLLYLEDGELEAAMEKSELLCISEIKKQKGGGMEIKFADRIKALEAVCRLCENEGEAALGAADLIRAITQSAREADDEA